MANKKTNKKEQIMLVVVVLLLIFSTAQAVQINGLKDEINTGTVLGFSTGAVNGPAVQKPIQQASTMVGGC